MQRPSKCFEMFWKEDKTAKKETIIYWLLANKLKLKLNYLMIKEYHIWTKALSK